MSGETKTRGPSAFDGARLKIFITAVMCALTYATRLVRFLANNPIPIHKGERQTRIVLSRRDSIAEIFAAIVRSAANGEVINIGSTHEIRILALAKSIRRSQ